MNQKLPIRLLISEPGYASLHEKNVKSHTLNDNVLTKLKTLMGGE
jgi:hypothetical protein